MMNPKWQELVDDYFIAIYNDDIPKVEELLSSGAVSVDLRFPRHMYRTALHNAGKKGYYDLVRLLVDKYHAQVNVKDKEGKIPLELATDYDYPRTAKFLLKRNSEFPNQELVKSFKNTEEVDELFEAAELNNIKKIAELITERGVDVDSEDIDYLRGTILEVAATKGFYDLVKILVDTYGADIQHTDEIGEGAWHWASSNGHKNIVNFLLERGFLEPEEAKRRRYMEIMKTTPIDRQDDIETQTKIDECVKPMAANNVQNIVQPYIVV